MNAGSSSARRDSPEILTNLDIRNKSTLRRLLTKHKTRLHLVKLLINAGLPDEAEKVRLCGAYYRVLATEAGHVVNFASRFKCGNRACPSCGADRANRAFERYLPKILKLRQKKPFYRLVMLTVTIDGASSVRDELLRDQIKQLKGWLSKLKRSKKWKAHLVGGIQSVEDTYNPERDQFHVHAHLLLFRKGFFHWSEITELWKKVSKGHGGNIKIQKVESVSLRGAVSEITKYVLKPADIFKWSSKQVLEHQQLKGMHLCESFGEVRSTKVSKRDSEFLLQRPPRPKMGDLCPCGCGDTLYARLMPFSKLINSKFVGQGDDDDPDP